MGDVEPDTEWTARTLKRFFDSSHADLKEQISIRLEELEKRFLLKMGDANDSCENRFVALEAERKRILEDRDSRYQELIKAARDEIKSAQAVVNTRLDGMDKAGNVLTDNLNRVPTVLDREISRVIALSEEKFRGIQRQFEERDVRFSATEQSSATAINAALSAQKEAAHAQNVSNTAAIAKSESATTKQIDSIVALLNSASERLNDKIDSVSQRLVSDHGKHVGASATYGVIAGVIVIMISLAGVLISWNNSNQSAVTAKTLQEHLKPDTSK